MRKIAVIPAFNEERAIGGVVTKTSEYVDKIVVVDDGSVDKTSNIAGKAGAEVIRLDINTGKANAVREGLRLCSGYDAVIIMDGDGQHLPREIPILLEKLENSDLVIGSRFLKDATKMPLNSKISNKIASLLMSSLIRQKITDPQSGLRAIRGERVGELELKAERYALEHIMILEAKRKHFVISEAPITTVYGAERSDIHPVRDTLIVILNIMKFILRL